MRPSVQAQLGIGRRSSRRLTGLDPTGIWLPECAYKPGLEKALAAHGITHFFTDAALLPGHARPAGDVRRRRGQSELGRWAPQEERDEVSAASSTSDVDLLRPYYVGDSDVVAIARHDTRLELRFGLRSSAIRATRNTASSIARTRRADSDTGASPRSTRDSARKRGTRRIARPERARDHARHFVESFATSYPAEARTGAIRFLR